MTMSPEAQGHAPRSGRYSFTAEAGPGHLSLWINGVVAGGSSDPTEDGYITFATECYMSEADGYRFEAVPGPLRTWSVDFLGE